MATSGRINGRTYDGNGADKSSAYGTWIDWKRNSYSITNNTSNITVTVCVQRIDGYSGELAHDLTQKPSVSLSVGGSAKSPTIYYIDTRGHKVCTVATWTGDVPHNSDGTLNLALSCSYSTQLSYLKSGSISGTATLDTIPRASTIISIDGALIIGSKVTVNIARAVDTFKHQVWYKVGNSKWYDLGGGYGTSCEFTIDIATANQITTSTLGTMQVCVRTFNGTTQIGADYYQDFTIRTPPYVLNGSVKLTGNNLLSGAYVQGKSTVTAEITATEMYGAAISYSTTVDGKTYTGNKFTSSVLSNGSKTVSVTITDTRGEKATFSSSAFTVYAYAIPVITEFTLDRQEDETTVIATVKGTISAINNKNAKVITVELNGVTQTITSNSYTINGTTTFTNVPTDNTLTATARLTDSYIAIPKEATLPTVKVTEDYHYSGNGKAYGKVSEEEGLLDVAWKTKIADTDWQTLTLKRNGASGAVTINFQNDIGSLGYIGMTGNAANTLLRRWTSDGATQYTVLDTGFVKDHIIEQGTSGVWTYEKWNNGVLKCFANQSLTNVAVTTAWGAIYCSPQITLPLFPSVIAFKEAPQVNVDWNGAYSASTYGVIGVTTTKSGYTYICRPDSVTLASGSIAIQVVGKWK